MPRLNSRHVRHRRRLANWRLGMRQAWDEHQNGRHNRDSTLWSVLMFEAWRERWSH
jgi:hypothetical protein